MRSYPAGAGRPTETQMKFPNRYPGNCERCRTPLAVGAGLCEKVGGRWTLECKTPCAWKAPAERKPEPKPQAAVGDLSRIMALFAFSSARIKFPAVELGVPGFPAIRINVAGASAKVPGSLTVVRAERNGEGKRPWLGRIRQDGTFEPSRDLAPVEREAVANRMRAFAADPSKVGAEDGLLHARCCYCRIALTDERSTLVGYGAKCAKNWGLAWGSRPATFASFPESTPAGKPLAEQMMDLLPAETQAAVQVAAEESERIDREMQLMEAEGDRRQTKREERAKAEARRAMETDGTDDYQSKARAELARLRGRSRDRVPTLYGRC